MSSDKITQLIEKYSNINLMEYTPGDYQQGVISTDSNALDSAIGVGGIPRGRVIQVYGRESSGKTTLALILVKNAQRQGLTCLYVDLEGAINVDYAAKLGVDLSSLLVLQPDSGEDALDTTAQIIKNAEADLVILDSIAAVVPTAEEEGSVGDNQIGLQARLVTKFCNKISNSITKSNTTLVIINQLRANISGYGSSSKPAGGWALTHLSSVTIRLSQQVSKSSKTSGEIFAIPTAFKVEKNKVGPPHKTGEFRLYFYPEYSIYGIFTEEEVLEEAVRQKVVKKGGTWYKYTSKSINEGTGEIAEGDEVVLGQGSVKAALFLRENPELFSEIKRQLA